MNLPYDLKVSVSKLSSCFRNTSATYKYYWLQAIIESVEGGKDEISKKELFARMIANAWFTVNYFHVSFGMQDKLQQAIEKLKGLESKLTPKIPVSHCFLRFLKESVGF